MRHDRFRGNGMLARISHERGIMERPILRESSATVGRLARLGDALLVLLTGYGAWYFRHGFDFGPIHANYHVAVFMAALAAMVLFPLFGLYRTWQWRELGWLAGKVVLAWGSVLALLLLFAFLLKQAEFYSRVWYVAWGVSGAVAVWCHHLLVVLILHHLRRSGVLARRVLLVGAGDLGREVARRLATSPESGYRVVGYLDDDRRLWRREVEGVQVFGGVDEVAQRVEAGECDEVWLTLPLRAEHRIRSALHALRFSTVTVRFVPNIFGFQLLNYSVTAIAGTPILDISVTPMRGINRLVKAIEDRFLALLILAVAGPLMVVIAVAVKLSSPGPVLFVQTRHGWDGRPIRIYKFRTMYLHDEPEGQVTPARRDDARCTPVGRLLRRTSLDELPQLINVLQGRMSLVGPRPHAVEHNEAWKEKIDAYMLRHKVKPGITGWAQVNGWRGETDTLDKMERRIEYDLYYIEHWSVWFDLRILWLTLWKGFVHENAY